MSTSASEQQLDAWRAVVTAHAAVTERVQKAFAAADLPPLSWYELLRAVKASADGRPTMSELAALAGAAVALVWVPLAVLHPVATAMLGGPLAGPVPMDDRSLSASAVLTALAAS